jgi:hypothetical protein
MTKIVILLNLEEVRAFHKVLKANILCKDKAIQITFLTIRTTILTILAGTKLTWIDIIHNHNTTTPSSITALEAILLDLPHTLHIMEASIMLHLMDHKDTTDTISSKLTQEITIRANHKLALVATCNTHNKDIILRTIILLHKLRLVTTTNIHQVTHLTLKDIQLTKDIPRAIWATSTNQEDLKPLVKQDFNKINLHSITVEL